MRKKVIRLTESDVERLVKKILIEENSQVIEEGWKDVLAGIGLTFASLLPQGLNAQDLTPQDKETIKHSIESVDKNGEEIKNDTKTIRDTVEMISMDQDRDTVRKLTTTAYKIYKNRKGDVKKVVADIKTEFTQPNSWDIDSTKTSTEQERTAQDEYGRVITLTSDGELEIDGRWMKSPKMMAKIVAGIKDTEAKKEAEAKLPRYTKEYNRLKKLVK